MEMMKQIDTKPAVQPIIVTGVHRSGTSLLARLLEQSGLFMGAKKERNNEAVFFLRLDDWILFQTGGAWDNIEPLKYLKYRSLETLDFPWGWKDPRTTVTLPIWLDIFPEAKIICIYRHGVDVAESLRVKEIIGSGAVEESWWHSCILKNFPRRSRMPFSPRCYTLEGGFRQSGASVIERGRIYLHFLKV